MPVVPTSPLRVVPQAPTVNPALFTQVPSVQEGMQAFETGAKLPLMMEQIKHEKKRIKMENAKLDFAMSEAGKLQEQTERELVLAGAAAKIKADEAEAYFKVKQAEDLSRVISLDGGLAAETPPAATPPAAPPLAKATLEEKAAPVTPEPTGPLWNGPTTQGIVSSIEGLMPGVPPEQKAMLVRDQLVKADLVKQWGGTSIPAKYGAQLADSKAKLMEQYSPKREKYRFTGDGDTPMVADAILVGGQPVALLSAPVVDVKSMHDNNAGLAKIDEEMAKSIADVQTGAADRKLASNLTSLNFAREKLTKSDTITGPLISLMPEAVRRRIPGLQDGMAVRDAVRSVVQQSLRETLGAQFARIEGEMMMERAFDPTQPESENVRRLDLLAKELVDYTQAKKAATDYYTAHGTMYGYRGRTLDDLAIEMSDRFLASTGGAPAAEAVGGSVAPAPSKEDEDFVSSWVNYVAPSKT